MPEAIVLLAPNVRREGGATHCYSQQKSMQMATEMYKASLTFGGVPTSLSISSTEAKIE